VPAAHATIWLSGSLPMRHETVPGDVPRCRLERPPTLIIMPTDRLPATAVCNAAYL